MNLKKKVSISVFDHDYVLLTDNNEAEVLALAEKVDGMMKDISQKNPKYSQLMVAIMGALRLADSLEISRIQLEETEKRLDFIQNEMKKPFEELNDLKQELEAIREQYTRTQSEFTKTQIDLGKVSREWARVQEELRDTRTELDVARENMSSIQAQLFDSQIELLRTKKELENLKKTEIPVEEKTKIRTLKSIKNGEENE